MTEVTDERLWEQNAGHYIVSTWRLDGRFHTTVHYGVWVEDDEWSDSEEQARKVHAKWVQWALDDAEEER